MDMVRNRLAGVSGYMIGDTPLATSDPNWKERIPEKHLLAAAQMLVEVVQDKECQKEGDASAGIVRLISRWSASSTGEMLIYRNLTHCFRSIGMGQRIRLDCAASSRATLYAFFTQLYDELISKVEGYSVGGLPISTASDARAHVDAWHKIVAIDLLTSAIPTIDLLTSAIPTGGNRWRP